MISNVIVRFDLIVFQHGSIGLSKIKDYPTKPLNRFDSELLISDAWAENSFMMIPGAGKNLT